MVTYQYPHPAVATDVVIMTVRDEQLQLLLIKRRGRPFKGKWALPGGFIRLDEDLTTAAARELAEETNVSGVFLEQLYTFGAVDRDPRERVISVAYYALVPSDKLQLRPSTDADAVGWFDMNDLPELAFDHQEIVDLAHQRLISKLDYSTLAFQFMPREFTLGELQAVYEIILQEQLDKRNFRKSMLALGDIVETGKMKRDGPHRPARLYRLKNPKKVKFLK